MLRCQSIFVYVCFVLKYVSYSNYKYCMLILRYASLVFLARTSALYCYMGANVDKTSIKNNVLKLIIRLSILGRFVLQKSC